MENQHGFTLLNTLIATALVTILSVIAAPSMASYFSKQESLSTMSLLHRHLNSARALAIKQGHDVTVCGIDDTQQCTREDFDKVAMFFDTNRSASIDENDQIFFISDIRHNGQLKLRASWRRTYIRIKETGTSEQAGSFIYCSPKFPASAKRLTVSMTGRSYIGRDTDGDGIVELANGDPIAC